MAKQNSLRQRMQFSRRALGIIAAFAAMLLIQSGSAVGATQSAAEDSTKHVLPSRSVWEFGVRVTAQSETAKVLVSFPIPMNWPEQSISIQGVDASPQVLKHEEKDLRTANLIVVNIGPLAAGEQAHLIITMAIEKKYITGPPSTAQFVFAKKSLNKMQIYLRASPLIESNDKAIRKLAKELPIDEMATPWQQVETIFKWVRDNIEYRFEETNRSCLEALATKQGDCGEMTGLFVALCRARGIPARAVWIPQHTYPEFYLEDKDGVGHWFPCQLAGPYEFGAMTEPSPILQKGDNFRLPGLPKAHRYVQPSLSADGGPVQLESIMRRTDKPSDGKTADEDTAASRVETDR